MANHCDTCLKGKVLQVALICWDRGYNVKTDARRCKMSGICLIWHAIPTEKLHNPRFLAHHLRNLSIRILINNKQELKYRAVHYWLDNKCRALLPVVEMVSDGAGVTPLTPPICCSWPQAGRDRRDPPISDSRSPQAKHLSIDALTSVE